MSKETYIKELVKRHKAGERLSHEELAEWLLNHEERIQKLEAKKSGKSATNQRETT